MAESQDSVYFWKPIWENIRIAFQNILKLWSNNSIPRDLSLENLKIYKMYKTFYIYKYLYLRMFTIKFLTAIYKYIMQ